MVKGAINKFMTRTKVGKMAGAIIKSGRKTKQRHKKIAGDVMKSQPGRRKRLR